jgi:benzoate 4-monooxygenase
MVHRACVGKNLANMELQIFIATIFRRYSFVLEDPEKKVRLISPLLSIPD